MVLARFGSDSSKPTITFYGHYDVVPATEVRRPPCGHDDITMKQALLCCCCCWLALSPPLPSLCHGWGLWGGHSLCGVMGEWVNEWPALV